MKRIEYIAVVVGIGEDVINERAAICFAHLVGAGHRKVGRNIVGSKVIAVRPIHVRVNATDRNGIQNVLCTRRRLTSGGDTKRHVSSSESTVNTRVNQIGAAAVSSCSSRSSRWEYSEPFFAIENPVVVAIEINEVRNAIPVFVIELAVSNFAGVA